jgi:hypothetical protein
MDQNIISKGLFHGIPNCIACQGYYSRKVSTTQFFLMKWSVYHV